MEAIAQYLHSRQEQLPGVSSLAAEVKAFAHVGQALTDQPYQPGMQQRIHQLQTVQPIAILSTLVS